MRRIAPLLSLLLASCSFATKLTGPGVTSSSPPGGASPSTNSSSSSSSNAQIAMPDILGKTPEQAESILRSAGFELRKFELSTHIIGCDYDRNKSYQLFTICQQMPPPGRETPQTAYVSYEIERSQGNRGEIGTPNEYIFMPDVRGKTLGEARAILTAAGLPVDKHFDVQVADEYDRCENDVVCQTLPGPKMRKNLTVRGSIKVGRPAPPKPPAPPPTSPTVAPPPTQPFTAKPDNYF